MYQVGSETPYMQHLIQSVTATLSGRKDLSHCDIHRTQRQYGVMIKT